MDHFAGLIPPASPGLKLDLKALAPNCDGKTTTAVDVPGSRLPGGENHPPNQQVWSISDHLEGHEAQATPLQLTQTDTCPHGRGRWNRRVTATSKSILLTSMLSQ